MVSVLGIFLWRKDRRERLSLVRPQELEAKEASGSETVSGRHCENVGVSGEIEIANELEASV